MRAETNLAVEGGAESGVSNRLPPPDSRQDRAHGARPHPRAWNTVLPLADPSI